MSRVLPALTGHTRLNVVNVDLYLLRSSKRSWQQLVCMLAGKAWPTHTRICITCKNDRDSQLLDEALWSQPGRRFIPHGIVEQPASRNAGVLIATQALAADILIDTRQAETLSTSGHHYQRILDIVNDDEGARSAARQRFKHYYKLTGQKPQTHEIA